MDSLTLACHHGNSCDGNGFNEMVQQAGVEVLFEGSRKPPAPGPEVEEKPKQEKFNAADFGDALMAEHRYWFTQEVIHRYNATTGVYEDCLPTLRKECRQGIGRACTKHHVGEGGKLYSGYDF